MKEIEKIGSTQIVLFKTGDHDVTVEVYLRDETFWLSQKAIGKLFGVESNTITYHLKEIFSSGELSEKSTCRKFRVVQNEGDRDISREILHYNLDAIISVGYRVNSKQATQFRIWATKLLNDYIRKGFVLDDNRLKELGGGNYFKELLDRIRDIRSSEKVLYRQVLDLYATSIDYDPKSEESIKFFKIVQNKLHYATHGHTASELIYERADAKKPFMGLKSFMGEYPIKKDVVIAKNYLDEKELKILNNLVSAYFDFAEISAIEKRPMHMIDYIEKLDNLMAADDNKFLRDAGTVSHSKALKKAIEEYNKYQERTLTPVEKAYFETIQEANKIAKDNDK